MNYTAEFLSARKELPETGRKVGGLLTSAARNDECYPVSPARARGGGKCPGYTSWTQATRENFRLEVGKMFDPTLSNPS